MCIICAANTRFQCCTPRIFLLWILLTMRGFVDTFAPHKEESLLEKLFNNLGNAAMNFMISGALGPLSSFPEKDDSPWDRGYFGQCQGWGHIQGPGLSQGRHWIRQTVRYHLVHAATRSSYANYGGRSYACETQVFPALPGIYDLPSYGFSKDDTIKNSFAQCVRNGNKVRSAAWFGVDSYAWR